MPWKDSQGRKGSNNGNLPLLNFVSRTESIETQKKKN